MEARLLPDDFENKVILARTEKRINISREKRKGYASNSDCLENFKVMSQLCKVHKVDVTKPEGVALFWIIHKLQRRCNLMSKGLNTAASESLNDTDLDMLNYIDLLAALELEEEAKESEKRQ